MHYNKLLFPLPTGQDIAHFLLASTTREFRKNHLETILQAYLTELEDVITHLGKHFLKFPFLILNDLTTLLSTCF